MLNAGATRPVYHFFLYTNVAGDARLRGEEGILTFPLQDLSVQ